MTRKSPRPKTTRRGKRPVEPPQPESPADELPSIILADDLLVDPETAPDPAEPPSADSEASAPAAPPDEPTPAPDSGLEPSPATSTRETLDDETASFRETLDDELASSRETLDELASSRETLDDADSPAPVSEAPAPRHPAPLPRVPLAPRPPAQRYAPAYDDSAPIEIPRYVEEEPRRAWTPPSPAPSPATPSAATHLDDDPELDLRSSRRKYNWLLVLACVIVGILGVVLGSRPDEASHTAAATGDTPTDPDAATTAGPDTTGADTASESDTTGGDTTASDTAPTMIRPDVAPPPPKVARALDEAKRALDERRWDAALLQLEHAVAEAPDNPRVLFGRARALQQLGRHDEALRDANAVLAADPTHPYALLLAAEALEKRGQAQAARPYYERYLAAWPKTRKAEEVRKALGVPPGK